MPGFATRDELITEATTNGKLDRLEYAKTMATATEAASIWGSFWTGTGVPPAGADPATTPGTVYIADQATAVVGSMFMPDRSTDQKHLLSWLARGTNVGTTVTLYDRLAGVSGISLASTGNKTINSGALDRYSGTAAVNNEVWLEVSTATTVTAPIVSLNQYTSADGTTGQSGGTVTFPAAATNAGAMIQVPLSATKQGVRSVEVGLNVGTAASAGVCNVLILRPLARICTRLEWNSSILTEQQHVNYLDDIMSLIRIYDNATLAMMAMCTSAVTAQISGTIQVAYG